MKRNMPGPDVRDPASTGLRAEARSILDGRVVRRTACLLKRLVIPGLAAWSPEQPPWSSQVQQKAWPSYRAAEQQVPDTVHSVDEHLARAADSTHPANLEGRSLHPDAMAAVRWLVGAGSEAEIARQREKRFALIKLVGKQLRPVRANLRCIQPDYILSMPGSVDVPLLAALCRAVGAPDTELALDFAMGFPAVGDIPASGWWPASASPKSESIESLDHAKWHLEMERAILAEWADPDNRDAVAAVWAKTQAERALGLTSGPFTRDQLEGTYGRAFRAMRRFGILQHGKIRACDNARTSLHNACTERFERMVTETADFPARAAAAFREVLGRPCPMRGGASDIAAFYRQVPTDAPHYTVYALANPESGEIEYYTLPSFNFGLSSAPSQCNRFTEAAVRIARGFMGICCSKFFDDFTVVEWLTSAERSHESLKELMGVLGMPFEPEKDIPVSFTYVFLGVESHFGEGPCEHVRMRVRPDRVERLTEHIEDLLGGDVLSSALAASLCGRLQFTLSWGFCRWGRAAMQPFTRRASEKGRPSTVEKAMTRAERSALAFYASALPSIPPYFFQVAPDQVRPALIWSDGASEPTDARPHTIGFVVAVPIEGAPPVGVGLSGVAALRAYYRIYHSSAALPPAFMDQFQRRKQQIGQVELVGALVPYLSLPGLLRGRKVLHWIDNSSAVAAAVKGYSKAVDSARIVHALHATMAGLGIRAWFEYVRTDANVSDKPSREDLSEMRYALGEEVSAAVRASLVSEPVPCILPDVSDWSRLAAEWIGL